MSTPLRLATYNVQSLRAGVETVARLLGPLRPDLLLVQECGPRRRTIALARVLGMELVSSHRPFNRVRNAVLFRHPWRAGERHVRDLAREGRTLRRGLIAVSLRNLDARFTAACTHLGLAGRERERHARELTDFLAGIDGPVVIGADLNEGPEGPAARWVGGRFFDAFAVSGDGPGATFPARAPSTRIDYLFAGEGIAVRRAWVERSGEAASASDHLPLVADVDLGGP